MPLQTSLPPQAEGNDLTDLIILGNDINVEEEGVEITLDAVASGNGNEVVVNTDDSTEVPILNDAQDSGVIVSNSNVDSGVIATNSNVDSANEVVTNDTEGSNDEVVSV